MDSIKNINTILDNFNNALDVKVTYILDIKGNTIAFSNRNAPDSFMGNNFSFRPYFKKAIIRILKKLNLRNNAEMSRFAIQNKLIEI